MPSKNQHRARHQHKDQHHFSKGGLVETSVKFHAKPCTGEKRGQSEQKHPDRVIRYRTLDAKPHGTDGEGRHGDRLKDGALPVFRPTAQAAPDRHQYAREPRYSSEHAIEKSDTGVSGYATGGYGRHLRTNECVEAVEHENYADPGLDERGFAQPRMDMPTGTPMIAPARNGQSLRQSSACFSFQTE